MKILVATGLYPPDIGGPATYSRTLATELPKRGIEVSVLTFGEVRELPKPIRHLVYFFKILVRGRGADIVYAQDPISVGLPAALAAKILRKTFLVRIAGDYAWEQGVQRFGVKQGLDEFIKNPPLSFPIRALRFLERRVALSARMVVVPSHYLKRVMSIWGVPLDKIQVIENTYDGPEPTEDKDDLRRRLGFNLPTIVSVGRLVPWKGFVALINAMPGVLSSRDASLYIVGDGPMRAELLSLIEEKKLEGQVKLLGRLPQSVMHNYVRAADVFVLSSTYEGFSHQLLESMAMETPVVTTDIPGNFEIARHNKNALVVPPDRVDALSEAILLLLNNKEHGERLVAAGRETVKEFGVERMLGRVEALIKKIR